MVRLPRMYSLVEDGFYHVIARGNKRSAIYQESDDYYVWKRFLSKYKKQFDVRVLAYCLMINHFHLLVRCGNNLSRFMGSFNARYAMYFNSKYNLSGHLFQGRYKSYLVADDPYLFTLIRYIHNNPVRANLVEFAHEYEHSSLSDYKHKKSAGLTDIKLIDNLIEKRAGGTPLAQILC